MFTGSRNTTELSDPQANGKVRLCVVREGDQFYVEPAVNDYPILVPGHEMSLEALCQKHGWTCFLLPGLGVGWVENLVTDEGVDWLREALRDHLGHHLLSLDWNGTSLSDAAFESLAALLGGLAPVPALQEFRVNGAKMDHEILLTVHKILQTNKTVRVIELEGQTRRCLTRRATVLRVRCGSTSTSTTTMSCSHHRCS